MKLGQLIEYNIRNIFFLEKPCKECSGETIARPYHIRTILSISLNQYSDFIQFGFFLYSKLGAPAFSSYKAYFLKNTS